MFGYIVPRLDVLSEEQQKRYRSFYCGLCRELGLISGRSGRLLLSHDMTFLAILLNSLTEPAETVSSVRCAAHPMRPREITVSKAVSYAAAMNLFLMDFKCEDQVADDHSGAARMERKKLHSAVETMKTKYPAQYGGMETALKELWQEEKNPQADPDRLCNLSGEMLGAAFVPDWVDDFWTPSLRGLGESLGRFVYWMDAWDDRKSDRQKGRFNPLSLLSYPEEEAESTVKVVLEMMLGEAADCFEMLPLEKDLDLLRNVLYSGVWQKFDAMKQRAEKRGRKNA